MTWTVRFHADFAREADALSEAVRIELIAGIRLLEHRGPSLIKRADARFDQHLEALK